MRRRGAFDPVWREGLSSSSFERAIRLSDRGGSARRESSGYSSTAIRWNRSAPPSATVASGPAAAQRRPRPSATRRSRSTGSTTPWSTSSTASRSRANCSRLMTNPGTSPTRIGSRPRERRMATISAVTAGSVAAPAMSSTIEKADGGLKKCVPSSRDGSRSSAAISPMRRDDVLVAGLRAAKPPAPSASSRCFSSSSSGSDSTTRWAPAAASPAERRQDTPSLPTRARATSRGIRSELVTRTSWPARAYSPARAAPIRPIPRTATRSGRGGVTPAAGASPAPTRARPTVRGGPSRPSSGSRGRRSCRALKTSAMPVAHASAGKPSDFSKRTSQSSGSAASVTKYAVSVSTTANRRFRRRMRSKADNDSPVLDADVVPPQPDLSQGEALPRRDVKFHPVPRDTRRPRRRRSTPASSRAPRWRPGSRSSSGPRRAGRSDAGRCSAAHGARRRC